MKIESFEWDDGNEQHILQRHGIRREEVEEVFYIEPYFKKGRDNTKYCYGQTEVGRYLFVVYLYKSKGRIRRGACKKRSYF